MDTLFILVPISLVGVAVIAGLLWWAIDSGQYDDMKGPAESILCDDDAPSAELPAVPEDRSPRQ